MTERALPEIQPSMLPSHPTSSVTKTSAPVSHHAPNPNVLIIVGTVGYGCAEDYRTHYSRRGPGIECNPPDIWSNTLMMKQKNPGARCPPLHKYDTDIPSNRLLLGSRKDESLYVSAPRPNALRRSHSLVGASNYNHHSTHADK